MLTFPRHLAQFPVLGAGPAARHPTVKVVEHATVVVAVHERHEQVRPRLRGGRGAEHVREPEPFAIIIPIIEGGGRVVVLVAEEVVHPRLARVACVEGWCVLALVRERV